MDQLVVLQEIYSSFSRGGDGLQEISSRAIEGSCPELIAKLLEGAKHGQIDEDVCRQLSGCLVDVYEIKRMGDICRGAGMYALAINNYNKALSLCHDSVLRPVLQNNLGQAYARQGDLARAVFYYKKSACCFEKSGDLIGLAHVLGNLGSAYRQNKDWDRAIEYCYRSLKTFEEKGDDLGIAQMTGSLGRIYADMGERDLAARYFERSLEDFQGLGDKKSAAWILDRMGRIASERYDWDGALSCYQQSLALFEEQGHTPSKGIVLSNMGRVHLERGDASKARECLEDAIPLIGQRSLPGRANALSALAATYSTLAEGSLLEAEDNEDLGLGSGRLQRQEASRNFSLASGCFLELQSTLPGIEGGVERNAKIAECRSHLARLSGYISDEEAVDLADKALASLDLAAENADEPKSSRIKGLERSITGIREARSIGLMGDEPWRLSRSVCRAIEHLLAGARVCEASDVSSSMTLALEGFLASMKVKNAAEYPAEGLSIAVAQLRHAGEHLSAHPSSHLPAHSSALKRDSRERDARRLIEAAAILEGQRSRNDISAPAGEDGGHNRICFGPERDALLLIGSAMINSLLEQIDDTREILVWDESLNLIPSEKRIQIDIVEEDGEGYGESGEGYGESGEGCETDEEITSDPERDYEMLPDLEISEDRAQAQELILADGTVEPSEFYLSEIVYPTENWLVPARGSAICRKGNPIGFNSWRQSQFYGPGPFDRLEKPSDGMERIEEGADGGLLEALHLHGDGAGEKERWENELEHPGPGPREPLLEGEGEKDKEAKNRVCLFSSKTAVLLIKVMAVVVILLMAIEAVLYLI
ncbi:tetratricopeptide repeat protein [Methanothrix sp.]|uniref:tetratricopeptide repeat protein n=1 Tax=Methanothrix sp. TaxID=90426 RepID=UPI003BAF050C